MVKKIAKPKEVIAVSVAVALRKALQVRAQSLDDDYPWPKPIEREKVTTPARLSVLAHHRGKRR